MLCSVFGNHGLLHHVANRLNVHFYNLFQNKNLVYSVSVNCVQCREFKLYARVARVGNLSILVDLFQYQGLKHANL